jgi:transcriptional regulator with XRE-family HTH domain
MIPSFIKIEGWEPRINNLESGKQARILRESYGVSGRKVAKHMGYVSSMISELENGTRGWSVEKANAYVQAIHELKNQ